MRFATILKLYTLGRGYELIASPQLDTNILNAAEKLMPNTYYFEEYDKQIIRFRPNIPIVPCVSFSFSPLKLTKNEQLFLGSIGCYWLDRVDESGRPGLSFWHAFIYTSKMETRYDSYAAAGSLMYLVRKYQDNFQQMGELLSEIATNHNTNIENSVSDLMRIGYDHQPTLDVLTIDMIERVRLRFQAINYPFNLSIPFPFSPLLAIPILVDLSMSRRVNIAGGMVADADLKNFPCVSVPLALSTHKNINLGICAGIPFETKLFQRESGLADESHSPNNMENQHGLSSERTDAKYAPKIRLFLNRLLPKLPLWLLIFLVLFLALIGYMVYTSYIPGDNIIP